MTLRTPSEQYAYDTRRKAMLPRAYPGYLSFFGTGSPEGLLSAPETSRYLDTATKDEYEKTSGGTGSTGWTLR